MGSLVTLPPSPQEVHSTLPSDVASLLEQEIHTFNKTKSKPAQGLMSLTPCTHNYPALAHLSK